MNLDELNSIARKMVAPGKGLLAADESNNTIGSASPISRRKTPRTIAAPIANSCSAPMWR